MASRTVTGGIRTTIFRYRNRACTTTWDLRTLYHSDTRDDKMKSSSAAFTHSQCLIHGNGLVMHGTRILNSNRGTGRVCHAYRGHGTQESAASLGAMVLHLPRTLGARICRLAINLNLLILLRPATNYCTNVANHVAVYLLFVNRNLCLGRSILCAFDATQNGDCATCKVIAGL